MSKQSFIKGASILTASGLIVKLLGGLYRIPLTNILGAEGIGLYQLVYPVFSLLLIVSTAGLPVAISKLVAGSDTDQESKTIYKNARRLLLIMGAVGTIILLVLAKPLALLQGSEQTSILFIAIAPSIFFVCLLSSIRGYFQGKQNMLPTATSQIIEQLAKITIGIVLSLYLIRFGVVYAALGAILGVTISEFVAFIFLQIYYKITNYKADPSQEIILKKSSGARNITKEILFLAIPITLGSIILPLTQLVDSLLIVNTLKHLGYTAQTATRAFGVYAGGVNTLVAFPQVITIALSLAIVPAISANLANGTDTKKFTTAAVKIALLIIFPCVALFILSSEYIIPLMYSRLGQTEQRLAISLLRVNALTLFYMALLQIFVALLQAYNKPKLPLLALGIGLIIKIPLSIILLRVPALHIFGASIATTVSLGISCLLCLVFLRRQPHFIVECRFGLIVRLVTATASAAFILYFLPKTLGLFVNTNIAFVFTLFIAFALYIIIALFSKAFTKDELQQLPLGKYISKLTYRKHTHGSFD